MLINLSWVRKYVEIPVDTSRLINDLTMAGLNVEGFHSLGVEDRSIIVGEVLQVSPHPNADKLTLCRVGAGGGEVMEIVCGASNVAKGQKVPVALPGAKLPDGTKIKKTKIRGIVSNGMICSEKELGLGENSTGIMVLDDEEVVGVPIADSVSPAESILEIEVTPNRPDLLSHVGVAREVAALYKTKLKFPDCEVGPGDSGDAIAVTIENGEDCPRYTGRILKGVKVGPSPSWLRQALKSMGLNSINNIVDITNYVMMELGQPLHAFDLDKLDGKKIVVRRAKKRERLLALDGNTYELSKDYLCIADASKPVALAGVIGGERTAVTETTKNILIESACFNPVLVRKVRKAIGITTEASYRFERGSDREICAKASARACKLILEDCGGEIGGFVDNYPKKLAVRNINLRSKAIKRLLGVSISLKDVKANIEPLELICREKDDEALDVIIPSFRSDLLEEADVIEEVARTYGYERIGKVWDYRCNTFARRDSFDDFLESILDYLISIGFTEVITSSFSSGWERDLMVWGEDDLRRRMLEVRNPLSSLHSFLRTSLLPGMLQVMRKNYDQGFKRQKVCQAGKVFLQTPGEEGLPEECMKLTMLLTRPKEEDFWLYSKKAPLFIELKSIIESMARSFKVDLWHDFCYAFEKNSGKFQYLRKDTKVIEGGIVPQETAKRFEFDQPIWYADMDLAALFKLRRDTIHLKPPSGFPISKRDLSLVTPAGVTYSEIEKSLVKGGGGLVESIKLFDVFKGGNLPKGSTAYGVRIHFRSAEKTLTDEEIDSLIRKMLSKLKGELGIELRS